jgi:hypothetical protein
MEYSEDYVRRCCEAVGYMPKNIQPYSINFHDAYTLGAAPYGKNIVQVAPLKNEIYDLNTFEPIKNRLVFVNEVSFFRLFTFQSVYVLTEPITPNLNPNANWPRYSSLFSYNTVSNGIYYTSAGFLCRGIYFYAQPQGAKWNITLNLTCWLIDY